MMMVTCWDMMMVTCWDMMMVTCWDKMMVECLESKMAACSDITITKIHSGEMLLKLLDWELDCVLAIVWDSAQSAM
jgi:hypothetical protein